MPMSEYYERLRARVGDELLLLPGVSGLVYDDAGRILLVRESEGGTWATPGGATEPGESPHDAVVREVWEETDLLVEPVALRGVYGGETMRARYPNGHLVEYVSTMIECVVRGGALRADGQEVSQARFFAPGEIEALSLARWVRALLPEILAERGRTRVGPVRWRPPQPGRSSHS